MRPYFVAIVGAGPSGYYAAASLLKFADGSVAGGGPDIRVDMLEMLPTPWGLVRSGVAPDHPKIKSISKAFEKTSLDPRFRFFGNIAVGRHVQADELASRYDAVVYAVGAQSDRALNIPGEELPGSVAAVDFVGWYNAHPHFEEMAPDISSGRAVVVGVGNVALDVARILVTDPDVLANTDIADHALEMLHARGVEEVVIIGRRGPLQSTFTTLELRELGELEGVDVVVDPADLADITDEDAEAAGRLAAANMKVLRDYAAREHPPGQRRIVFRFRTSPIEIRGQERVESIVLGVNELVTDDSGRVVARDTGEREELACDLILRSVGYTGVPLRGVPFDERRGTILNEDGRVLESHGGDHRTGHYTAGWIKRGPSGVIGTNKKCATETVAHVFEDVAAGRLLDPASPDPNSIEELLRERGTHYVSFSGWEKIDAAEVGKGEPHGRPRVKFVRIDEMLETAAEQAEAGAATGGE